MGDFDPNDENSWYFGILPREESTSILQSERDRGVFLVRSSVSIHGDYVLCVKEDARISNYIINKIQTNGRMLYRIGDQEFDSLAELLAYYKIHYLDTTTLVRPAKRQKFITRSSFQARDSCELTFCSGEVLTLLCKDEDDWWTVQDSRGNVGTVPGKLLDRFDGTIFRPPLPPIEGHASSSLSSSSSSSSSLTPSVPVPTVKPPAMKIPRVLPAVAMATKRRVPSAYDTSALPLEVGDKVLVEVMHETGQWQGSVNGRSGFFPFTHIEFIEEKPE